MFEYASWYTKLPEPMEKVHVPYFKLFFETMFERQLIWKRRFIEKKDRPWTNNEIFAKSKFTNVYRELDRNSQWLIKNIITDESLSKKNLIWKMMVFRFFNNPETFEFDAKKPVQLNLFEAPYKSGLKQAESVSDLISAKKWRNGIPDWEEYDEDEFSRFIAGVRSAGQNPYTTAYLINSMATPGQSRDYCYTRLVIPYLHDNIDHFLDVVEKAEKPEQIIACLKTFPSVADFIAHEFYQDFTYIPKYTEREFMKFDQNDFTNVGPGASLGIRLIFPNLQSNEQKQAIYKLRNVAEKCLNKIAKDKGEEFPYLYYDKTNKQYYTSNKCNITLHQIEMWLCEFQKYWKMMIGEGKQRSEFKPRTIVK